MTLNELLKDPKVTLEQVQKHLASLAGDEQVRQSTTLDRGALPVLWRLADKTPPITLNDFVPADKKPLEPVPFQGQNTLPAFRMFQKVFYRTNDGRIAGYNKQAMGWLTGPGYYIVKAEPASTYIDYTEIPKDKPGDFPAIKRNEDGLSSLVYGGMKDYMRRVHGKIMIGHAVIKGKDTPNYFVLAHA